MKPPSSSRPGAAQKGSIRRVLLAACALMTGHAVGDDMVTEGRYYACLSEQWLEDFTSSAVREDAARVEAYLAGDKCLVLKPNLPVAVVDEPDLPGTRIAFSIQGIRFYAPSEEIVRK